MRLVAIVVVLPLSQLLIGQIDAVGPRVSTAGRADGHTVDCDCDCDC